jgi:hypothetical protein
MDGTSSRKREGSDYRGGREKTSMVMEGARYALRRPRVRRENQEVELPTLAKLQSQYLLDQQIRQRLMLGVSTRNYEQVVDGYSEKLSASYSLVSRTFIGIGQTDLDSINEGKPAAYGFIAILIDSRELGGRTVGAALGSSP